MSFHSIKQWRVSPRRWDDFYVPSDLEPAQVFTWVGEQYPEPMEHDYLLFTDGSGCTQGWGAHAAVIQRIDLDPEKGFRRVVDSRVRVGASYGSTVQRNELTAMLDGLHEILQWHIAETRDDDGIAVDNQRKGLQKLVADDRVTVMWFTDRSNLAKALLFDEHDRPLNARASDVDLWLRFSSMARFACITPMLVARNSVPEQAACDAMCSAARLALKGSLDALQTNSTGLYPPELWTQPKAQKALF